MNICSSSTLQNDYNSATETREPVNTLERREQMPNLQERLLVAERERNAGQILSIEGVDAQLRGKFHTGK